MEGDQLFPHPRRIVTGHDSSGNAVVIKDSIIECKPTPVKCNFAVLWETSSFPSDNNDERDPAELKTESLVNDKGVILRVVDFPPKTETLFHRTISLDFGILMEGEIECRLDNDVVIKMKKGDTCVQRGTIHGWTNTSDKPARVYFVLTAAKPVEINGKQFGDAGFSHEEVASGGK